MNHRSHVYMCTDLLQFMTSDNLCYLPYSRAVIEHECSRVHPIYLFYRHTHDNNLYTMHKVITILILN